MEKKKRIIMFSYGNKSLIQRQRNSFFLISLKKTFPI